MKWLFELLRTPSSFPTDPWGYARNQLSHGYLIGGLPVLIFPWLAVPVILIYLLWENHQIQFYDSELSDSIEDFANVLTILLAVVLHNPALLFVHFLFLLVGIQKRVEERHRNYKSER